MYDARARLGPLPGNSTPVKSPRAQAKGLVRDAVRKILKHLNLDRDAVHIHMHVSPPCNDIGTRPSVSLF